MKNVCFITSALVLGLTFAQAQQTSPVLIKGDMYHTPVTAKVSNITGNEIQCMDFSPIAPLPSTGLTRSSSEYNEYQAINTYYDLQSNSALSNRIAIWPDGSAAFVATMDRSGSTSWPNRGTGYNYYNGSSMGNIPSNRIESVYSGWPSIAPLGNGEILASHGNGNVNIFKRTTKGQGTWQNINTLTNVTWPRIATTGNGQYVHLVCCEENSSNNLENYVYYARSTNGGQTFSSLSYPPQVDVAGMYKYDIGEDDYVIATNGDRIAILFGGKKFDLFYIISHDNGATWSKQIIWNFPYNHAINWNQTTITHDTDSIWAPDGSHSIAIDDNGVVHVAFGLTRWAPSPEAGAGYFTYWPYTNGIVYWNSQYVNQQGGHNIPNFGSWSGDNSHPEWTYNGTNGISSTLNLDRLVELANADGNNHLYVIIPDENHDGTVDYTEYWDNHDLGKYRTHGISTMPAIAIDESGRMIIAYSTLSESKIDSNSEFYYRICMVTTRDQQGNWNDDAINLSENYNDEIYYVTANSQGRFGTFWLLYGVDSQTGLYLDNVQTELTDNHFYANKLSPWGQISTYSITATANPTNGGTITGAGSYASGSTCTLHATPNSGYSFVKWTKNGTQVSTNPNYSFTVTGNASYVAHFQQNTTNYTITATASPSNAGTITGAGSYASGSTCTLRATPNSGYTFANWLENSTSVSTNATYSFTVTGNRNLVAVFDVAPTNYTITATANPSNGGTVSGGGTYASGSTCTLRATPNSGYTFVNWTKNGTQVSTNATYSFTVTGSGSYVANFEPIPEEYTVTVNADPANGGTVSGGGTYAEGSTCVITAMPNDGYVFENWTRNGTVVSTEPTYSIVVNRNLTFVAHFAQNANQATITAMAEPVEGGSVSGGGTYELGSNCSLNAVAAVGYEFVNWTLNGSQVSTDASFSFTITGNAVYVAHFSKIVNHYSVSANVQPANAGSVIGASTYEEGASCTLIAMANPTYTFVSWTENGAVVSTDEQYTFTVERDRNLVAVFSQGQFYTITATAGPNGTITPEGEIIVEPGEDKTFAIIPSSGCRIIKVIVDGVDFGPLESYTFRNVHENHSIRAQFSGLGVDDNPMHELKVYPNPAYEMLNIEGNDIKRIAVYDILCTLHYEKETKESNPSISLVGFAQGTYLLKVEFTDGSHGWSRFVIAR